MIKRQIKKYLFSLRFWLSKTNNPLFLYYYNHIYKTKKGSLSEKIDQFSSNASNNIFVLQVGANDGISNDPIHKFIKRDHWSGLLIEPQPQVFQNYLTKLHQRNAQIQVLHAAIGPNKGNLPLYKLAFSEDRWATGLASFNKEHLLKAIEAGDVQRQCRKNNISFPSEPKDQITIEHVEVWTVRQLLEVYQITRIDLLMIDTESYDFEIIKLVMPEIEPKHIIYEHEHLSQKDLMACREMLTKKGYDLQCYGSNTWAEKI